MATLNENLAIAQLAVNKVVSVMTIGASNKISDVLTSFYGSVICVVATRSVDIATPAHDNIPKFIRVAAAKAEHVGCGNCGEQAAIAFVFLVDRRVTPIDYMERTNADHAFVVIDRKVGSDVKDISTWGDTAVVCDPWDEKVYAASEIPSKMYGGGTFAPRSVYRHQ